MTEEQMKFEEQMKVEKEMEFEEQMKVEKEMEFEKKLEMLINEYSKENESDTPSFILAQYLKGCLANYVESVKVRDKWYGFKDKWYGFKSLSKRYDETVEKLKLEHTK